MFPSPKNSDRRLSILLPLVLLSVLLSTSIAEFVTRASPSPSHGAPPPVIRRSVTPRPQPLLSIVNQPDILERHRILSDKVLRALPALCRRSLKNFYVRYGGSDRRGYGGKSTIVLDGSVRDREFAALLIHECGHVIHANLGGREQSGISAFRDGAQIFYADAPIIRFFRISWERENVLRAGAEEENFASGYGKTDAFEDFAEFLLAYALHSAMLEERAEENAVIAAKLAWMRRELPMTGATIARGLATWTGEVPWDMTKLPIELAVSDERLAVRR